MMDGEHSQGWQFKIQGMEIGKQGWSLGIKGLEIGK
jgi:hypothetical protein